MSDYYVYERGTTSGGTVYEPMHRDADPNDGCTTAQFDNRDDAEAWIAFNGTDLTTATYTDPLTGWTQRVEVRGPAVADAPAPDGTLDWRWVRNVDGEHAKVPDSTLSDARRQQGANREYLARTR
jgi:hypothetical protein